MFDQTESKKFLKFVGAGMLVLLLFALVNIYRGAYLHAFIELVFCLSAGVVTSLFHYHKIKYYSALHIFIALLSTFFLYLFYHGGIAQTGIAWSLSFPVFAFMLSNKRTGIQFSATHLLMILGIYLLSQWNLFFIHYDLITLRQMLAVYVLIAVLAYIYQDKVEESRRLLQNFNSELQDKIDRAIEDNKKQELHLFQQAKNAQMGELIGMIAHQWRQPLNALGLTVQKQQLMYDKGELSSKSVKEHVTKSMSLIHHMSKTVNDFMNYLKVEKEKQDFLLNTMIMEIHSILSMRLIEEEVNVALNIDKDITIHSYKSELSHVINNLICNALDAFMGQKLEDKKITVSAAKSEERNLLTCSVKDNAGGIFTEVIDYIFEPYFTTKEEGKGTGIGLHMSKRIVETLLEGTITASNDEDGAIFTVQIPLH